uniref:Uncharacterized protein n=1 Tax=Aegilops tauschii subsp. strangulata TaxID=200361 RepID=A0A453QXD3_AEGTS
MHSSNNSLQRLICLFVVRVWRMQTCRAFVSLLQKQSYKQLKLFLAFRPMSVCNTLPLFSVSV